MTVKKWIGFLKRETVLCAAWFLAIISMFLVPPDRQYLSYIDFHTIGLLFCLMTVMSGAGRLGIFRRAGIRLLRYVKSSRQLEAVLILLCFFSSMLITNDVALITFVPFALEILEMARLEKSAVRVVILQTAAANLGSMATPVGNPQNLYLYGASGAGLLEFMSWTFPFVLASLVLLAACMLRIPSQQIAVPDFKEEIYPRRKGKLILYGLLFLACLGTVLKLLPAALLCLILLVSVLAADRWSLRYVDYSLLLTFAGFFLFIGNMGRIPAFAEFLSGQIENRVIPVAVLSSQVISNVPAALLLSGFTDSFRELAVGTNLGGLGTLIASMASLISYKLIARKYPEEKGRYIRQFTGVNAAFLALLLLFAWVLAR